MSRPADRSPILEIGNFLSQGGTGPEKQELLRLIGTLVKDPEKPPTSVPSV